MISNFQVFVNNFFKFFIKQGYKDSNLEMTESESVLLHLIFLVTTGYSSHSYRLIDLQIDLTFSESLFPHCLVAQIECHTICQA